MGDPEELCIRLIGGNGVDFVLNGCARKTTRFQVLRNGHSVEVYVEQYAANRRGKAQPLEHGRPAIQTAQAQHVDDGVALGDTQQRAESGGIDVLTPAETERLMPVRRGIGAGGGWIRTDLQTDPRAAGAAIRAYLAGQGVDFLLRTHVGDVGDVGEGFVQVRRWLLATPIRAVVRQR